jgi:trk system potassium uptake protein
LLFAKLLPTFSNSINALVQRITTAIERNPIKYRPLKVFSAELSLAISFMSIILLGALILTLPVSAASGRASFVDALFTAASATCVTGLVVVDTGTYWSTFGQIVILILIQIGGLGIMTFSTFFVYLVARRLSIWNRDMIESNFAGAFKGNLGHLLLTIILGTLFIEAIGAILLTLRFALDFPMGRSVFLGIFHSISAFCNAGFSPLANNLVSYQGDPAVNLIIMALIVLGGLGFWVLFDLRNLMKRKSSFHSTTLHTRVVVYTSLALIVFGALWILSNEWNHSFQNMPLQNKIMASLFQSVTPRTAGFNTIDIGALTNSTLFIMIAFMLIGASPGSTGGGIKTTTFVIVLAMISAQVKNRRQVQIFKRGVPEHIVSKAIVITFFAVLTISLFLIVLLITEHPPAAQFPERGLFITLLFETVSAFGTVGLSMGITPFLSVAGKVTISLLMYLGRIGAATLAIAVARESNKTIKFAEDNVLVG